MWSGCTTGPGCSTATNSTASYSGEGPVSFSVSKVIPGWTEALQLMREGARWELYLPPELAYGRRGPLADQTVIYEIELLGVGEDSQATGCSNGVQW